MLTLITLGLAMLGFALGFTLSYAVPAVRRLRSAFFLACAAGITGAALMHFFVTPQVEDAWSTRRARGELLAVPVYALLARHEPDVFQRLLEQYKYVVLDRTRNDLFTHAANVEISTVATQHIAHASDAALLALMQDMLNNLQVLRAGSPDDCYKYLFPKVAGPPDVERFFDRASRERTLGLMADVIRTSAENPVAVPPAQRVQDLLGPIVNAMYGEFGESTQVLSHAEEPTADRRVVCTVAVSLYEKVMRLPPADSAAVIRSMTQL